MAIETVELEEIDASEEEQEEEQESKDEDEESEKNSSGDSAYNFLYDGYDPSIAAYLREISRFPLLKREEEMALAIEIVETQVLLNTNTLTELEGEKANIELESLKSRMIRSNLRLVVKIAKKYRGKMDLLDRIQEGNIGLMTAVEKFDPYRGYRFSTYAYWWIRQTITRAIVNKAETIRFPAHITTGFGNVEWTMKKNKENDGIVNVDSLVESLKGNYSKEQVQRILRAQKLQNPVSLNTTLSSQKGGKDKEFGDFIQDLKPSPEEDALNNITLEEIRAVLEQLNEKERAVIIFRFGLDDGTARTLEEVGKVLGVTRERVRQIQEKALGKLRHPLKAKKLAELKSYLKK